VSPFYTVAFEPGKHSLAMVGDSKYGDLGIYANAIHPNYPAGAKKNARFYLENKRKVCSTDTLRGSSASGGSSSSSSSGSSSSSSSSSSSPVDSINSPVDSTSEEDSENRPTINSNGKRPRPPNEMLYMPGNRAEFPLHASKALMKGEEVCLDASIPHSSCFPCLCSNFWLVFLLL
jgi:hypothetical protein